MKTDPYPGCDRCPYGGDGCCEGKLLPPKSSAAPMTVRLREKAPTAMVVAFQAGTDDIGERVECRSADEAGRAVANLLLRGFAYCHVDNLSALERFRKERAAP